MDVVGKELAGGGEEDGEAAGEEEASGSQEEEWPAISENGLEESRGFVILGLVILGLVDLGFVVLGLVTLGLHQLRGVRCRRSALGADLHDLDLEHPARRLVLDRVTRLASEQHLTEGRPG